MTTFVGTAASNDTECRVLGHIMWGRDAIITFPHKTVLGHMTSGIAAIEVLPEHANTLYRTIRDTPMPPAATDGELRLLEYARTKLLEKLDLSMAVHGIDLDKESQDASAHTQSR